MHAEPQPASTLKIMDQYLRLLFHRKEDHVQLLAASAVEMTHNKTLNQLDLLRNCSLHAQDYHITMVRRKVMSR